MTRRPRISQEFLEIHRRRRYVEAAAEILHEFGRPGITATNVVRLAGGSRGSFYQYFDGVEGCLACGLELAEEELFASPDARGAEKGWLTEVHEAVDGFLEAVAAHPFLAELFLVHSAAIRTDEGRMAFRTGGEYFGPLIRRGREEAEMLGRRPPPDLIAECLSRAIVELAARRVRVPQVVTLPEESRGLTLMVGGFYVGHQMAEEILDLQLAAQGSS